VSLAQRLRWPSVLQVARGAESEHAALLLQRALRCCSSCQALFCSTRVGLALLMS
jgi:hypothetical protein